VRCLQTKYVLIGLAFVVLVDILTLFNVVPLTLTLSFTLSTLAAMNTLPIELVWPIPHNESLDVGAGLVWSKYFH
jgi:hypothetical protein